MPNLRASLIEEFWTKKDPRMARILGWMESMEDWILDDNEDASESIFALANTLERTSRQNVLANAEDLVKMMAYLSSPRALRLMEWFDEHFPKGVAVEITEKAAEMADDEHAELLLDRFNTLHRLSLLSRMFAPHRTRMIVGLLQQHTAGMD